MSQSLSSWLVPTIPERRKPGSTGSVSGGGGGGNVPTQIFLLGIGLAAMSSFVIGLVVGSSCSTTAATTTTTLLQSMLDRLERFITGSVATTASSSSSRWNLYFTIVFSYITIRSYQVWIEPIQQQFANRLYGVYNKGTVVLRKNNEPSDSNNYDSNSNSNSATILTTTTPYEHPQIDNDDNYDDNSSSSSNSNQILRSRLRRTDRTSNGIVPDFQTLNRIDEIAWESIDMEDAANTDSDEEEIEVEEKKFNDGDAAITNLQPPTPRRRRKRRQQQQQPIDMSGVYQLISNDNFDSFLMAQGVSWMLARAADNARPIHRIIHIGHQITIKIEGIIESSSTYMINGPPVETIIRGRVFADQVTYLTVKEGQCIKNPSTSTKYIADNTYNHDYSTDRITPTISSSTKISSLNSQLSLPTDTGLTQHQHQHQPHELETITPISSHRRTKSLDSGVAVLDQRPQQQQQYQQEMIDTSTSSALHWMMASSTSTASQIGSAATYMVNFEDLMVEVGLKSTLGDLERATTDFKKSFDDMIVKPLNDTIDGMADTIDGIASSAADTIDGIASSAVAAAAIPVIEMSGSYSTTDTTSSTTINNNKIETCTDDDAYPPMERQVEVSIENGIVADNNNNNYNNNGTMDIVYTGSGGGGGGTDVIPNNAPHQQQQKQQQKQESLHEFKAIVVLDDDDHQPSSPSTIMVQPPPPPSPPPQPCPSLSTAIKSPNKTTSTTTTPTTNITMMPHRRHSHRDSDVLYCGIQTTKRAMNDTNYTITVRRHLLHDKSQIIMTSRVEFDDPRKDAVEAVQIFERIV
jgi:hypothetical protein